MSTHYLVYANFDPAFSRLNQLSTAMMIQCILKNPVILILIQSERQCMWQTPKTQSAQGEGSLLTAGNYFESGKSECNNSGYKLTGLTWWP